jgi:serine/threonine-protein kinase
MGTAILQRYVLLGPIGQGGVSVVYHAVDAHSPRALAIKLLAPTLLDDRRARDNVRREALITQRIRHPSVPKVYDFGDAPLPDGTIVPYVVMELLTGVALAGRLAGGGPLPWREAVSAAATVADVLAVAHRRGVVHRDLTADNIMMTPAGLKIIDFGLATTVDLEADGLNAPRVLKPVLGRRPAIPRHHVTAADLPADDVYALGVLLYQMLTGRSPYPQATPGTFLAAGRFRTVAPTPVLAVPGLPRRLADLCRACMAKRPEERPRSDDVALALWAMVAPREPARPAPGPPAVPAAPGLVTV